MHSAGRQGPGPELMVAKSLHRQMQQLVRAHLGPKVGIVLAPRQRAGSTFVVEVTIGEVGCTSRVSVTAVVSSCVRRVTRLCVCSNRDCVRLSKGDVSEGDSHFRYLSPSLSGCACRQGPQRRSACAPVSDHCFIGWHLMQGSLLAQEAYLLRVRDHQDRIAVCPSQPNQECSTQTQPHRTEHT